MRELTSHKVAGLNESVHICVLDEPGAGGACHVYDVSPMAEVEPSPEEKAEGVRRKHVPVEDAQVLIRFQNGPISESGINGISNEALLAIVEDRLKGFQYGPYACRENAIALTKIQEAMHWLHHRTRERVQRGVEGTSEK